jgi:hypothetical protein
MRHLPETKPKVETLLAHLQRNELNGPSQQWLGLIRAAYAARPQHPGGMKGWAEVNDTKDVDTLQVEFDKNTGALSQVWFPGVRNVAAHGTGITFYQGDKHSERRYGAVYTLASSRDTYIGYARDFGQIIVYHTV